MNNNASCFKGKVIKDTKQCCTRSIFATSQLAREAMQCMHIDAFSNIRRARA